MGVTRLQKTLFAVIILPFLFPIFSTSTSILLPTEVNISSVHHFTSDYVFISDITDAVKSKDNLWCEDINPTDILRVTYESNLTIGSVIDVYARSQSKDTYFDIYLPYKNSTKLGTSQPFTKSGSWSYTTISGLQHPADTFDFRIQGTSDSHLQFDYIHDAAPTHNTPILNSTTGNNYTTENLTVYNQSTSDPDGDNVTNIINWYRNNASITVLNMPFENSGDISVNDNFDDNSIDTNIWTSSAASGTINENNQIMNVSCSGTCDWWTGSIESAPFIYTPTYGHDFVATVVLNNYTVNAQTHSGIMLYDNKDNVYLWGRYNDGTNNNFQLERILNDVGTGALSNYASTTLPMWLRIRKEGTTKYFDYSTDGVSFINLANTTDLNGNYVGFFAKSWNGNAINPSFDNFTLTIYNFSTRDYSGYGNNGFVSGATWNATGGYDGKGAYEFDGINDMILINDSNSLDLIDNLTLMAWIKPDTIEEWEGIISKCYSTNTAYALLLSGTTTMKYCGTGGACVTCNACSLSTGAWQHVAVTYSGGIVKHYVNGALIETDTGAAAPAASSDQLQIGADLYGAAEYFDGHIDEAYVFNRSLSTAEILAIYNNRTNTMVAEETRGGDSWRACITPNDGYEDGTEVCSNNVTVAPIAVVNLTLNSTTGANLTTENLTINYTFVNNSDRAIINWYRSGTSITVLNMPFEGGSTNGWTKDYSGRGSNGTIINAIYNATGGYKGTGAYYFDGTGDYISAGTFNPTTPHSITLSAWINPIAHTSEGGYFNDYIIVKGADWGASDSYGLSIGNPSGATIDSNSYVTMIACPSGTCTFLSARGLLTANTWQHVAGVINANTVHVYVNGVLANTTTFSGTISTNANTVWIGRQNRGTYSYDFYGHIDDVQFYDRALSEAEILAIYSNQTNVTVAQETRGGEVWKACITPNDGYEDGTEVCSNNVTVAPIAVVNVTVNSTRGTNLTTENLTANYVLANGSDRAIINWYRNGTSITVLNMPFEGGSNTTWAKDYSGYGNNGSVTTLANPPYVPWLADGGYDGKGAYNFSLGYISIADSNSLDVTGYALTLEAWVYPRALTNFNAIVGKEDNDCSDDYWIYQFEGATDVINFRVATDISGRTGVASSALSANQWYYVVGTYDGATLRLYINGVLNNSADKTGTIETSTGPFSIGKYQGCNKDQFNGIVDNVRVYNKTLSPEQILAIYNNRTDMILSNETAAGDNWSACITPNDGTLDGSEACSNNLTIVSNNPPTQGTPILNSTLGTNLTTENLTVYNQSTADIDGNSVTNIINWYRNNASITLLNMPFEGGSLSGDADGVANGTKDYSGLGNNGTVYNATWNSTGGYNGKGAYVFNGSQYIDCGNTASLSNFASNYSIVSWVFFTTATNFPGLFQRGDMTTSSQIEVYLQSNRQLTLMHNRESTPFYQLWSAIDLNVWVHLAITWNGTNWTVYYNGVPQSVETSVGTPANPNTGETIYVGYGYDGYSMNGTIDDFYLYNRTLTAEQILALYNNRTDMIVSQETVSNDIWKACITPNDGTIDGTEICSNNLTVLAAYDIYTNNGNITVNSSNPAQYTNITVNATIFSADALNNVNASFYVDDVLNQSQLVNIPVGNTTVQFTWNATTIGNRSLSISIDADSVINEVNEANNNAGTTVLVRYLTAANLTTPQNNSNISRGSDVAGEDVSNMIDNNLTIIANVYDFYNTSQPLIANCSFYLNDTLLGTNLSNQSGGVCRFSFDKTGYSAGTYNLTVNISTNDNNSLQLHDSLYQQTSTFTIYVYSTTLAAVNNRAGVTSYNVGDAGILNMSIKRNDTLFDPQGITVTIKDSADPCTVAGSPLFTHTYPGDIQKTATGVYYSKTIFTATGQVHWCVYVSDVNANVSTASHSDRDVNSASGTINITIADNDSTTSNTTVILYDFNQYDLKNATLNLTNSSLVHSVTANSNYHTDINTSDGCKLYLQRFNSSSANPLILIQFANTTIPSNLKLLSSVIAVNGSAFNFSSANLTIPKNNLRIDYILHCTDWNFGTATCNSWQRNVTSDYSNYGSNSTHFWFSVTSFTGYAGGEGYNSNLTIYDDSDSETVYANNSIIFYANYSNSTTGISIDNATTECNISFNITPNGPYQMTYDASSGLWEYNRTVVSKGNYSWNVSCVNTAGYDNLTAEDNVTVQNSQPVFTPVSILPATAYTNDTLNATTTYTDTDNDAGNVTFVWFLNNSNIYNTTFLNVANNTILTSNLSGTNFSHFDLVNVTVYAFDGTNYSQNFTSTNTINISNTIPVVTTPSLLPTTVYKTNNLNATTTYTDLDLDSGSLLFMWYVNNVNLFNQTIINVANNTAITSNLSNANFSAFDYVNVSVQANDSYNVSVTQWSSTLQIQNLPPNVTQPSILPATAYTNDTLNATTTYSDTDNHTGNVTFVWFLNNLNIYNTTFLTVANNTILTSNLSGTNFSHFDLVNVTVYAFDGTNYSQNFTSTNTINISNTIPVVTTPSLLPATVYETNNLNATTTYTDLDLDSGSILFMWYVNNVNLFNQTITNVANNTAITSNLSNANFSAFDYVNVSVQANDSYNVSVTQWSSTLQIQNLPPNVTQPSILPATAYTNDTLNATTTYSDTDNHTGNVTFVWFLNNSNIYNTTFLTVANNTILTSNLSGTNFSHFDLINVTVYAFDGANYSQNFTSTNTINISNTVPILSAVSLTPTNLYATLTLNASVNYTDLDLDQANVTFIWYVNAANPANTTNSGVTNGTTTSATLSASYFNASDAVNVSVYANDSRNLSITRNASITVLAYPIISINISPSSGYIGDSVSFFANVTNATAVNVSFSTITLNLTNTSATLWNYSNYVIPSITAGTYTATFSAVVDGNSFTNTTNITILGDAPTTTTPSSSESSQSSITLSYATTCPDNNLTVTVSSGANTEVRLLLTEPYEGLVSSVTTNNNRAAFTLSKAGTYQVTALKPGYKLTSLTFSYTVCNVTGENQTTIPPIIPPLSNVTVLANDTNVTPPITPPADQIKINAESAISAAESAISAAKAAGKDTTTAESKLAEAKTQYNAGDYTKAKQLADEALTLAQNAQIAPTILPTTTTITTPDTKPKSDSGLSTVLGNTSLIILLIVLLVLTALIYLVLRRKK